EDQPFARYPYKKRFDLILACGVHSDPDLTSAEIGQKLYQLAKNDGIVLLESRGTGSTEQVESGFTAKAHDIADEGFEVVRTGHVCDDGRNKRMFMILRRR